MMADFIDKDDLVILSNRKEAQQLAVDLNVGCMVICGETEIADDILKQVQEKQIVIITSPHDSFTVARLINQSIPVRHFMTKEKS